MCYNGARLIRYEGDNLKERKSPPVCRLVFLEGILCRVDRGAARMKAQPWDESNVYSFFDCIVLVDPQKSTTPEFPEVVR